ncbi:HEAT repeat domain-containing protein [bacterium]|jgi:HEAT repeat protein|nr:MAG: HEAT repeat domain-containing protein [bacterium]
MDSPERDDGLIRAAFLRKIALTQDKQKRLKVLKAYARLDTRLAGKVLIEALGDPCEEIRDFLIRELSERESFDPDLAYAKLSGPPWYARSAVLRVLAARRPEGAVRHIERVLGDANADVRKCAAEALGEIGGRESLPLLVQLAKDQNPYVKAAAQNALRKASSVRFS